MKKLTLVLAALLVAPVFLGCGGGDSEKSGAKSASGDGEQQAGSGKKKKKFKPVELGGGSETATAEAAPKMSGEEQAKSTLSELQPFQILLGKWRWGTKKKFGDFSRTGEDLEWVWDFKSNLIQPALRFHLDNNPYYHEGWLTYLPEKKIFQLTTQDDDGAKRVLQGNWAENGEPKETSEGKKVERSYKLDLTQVTPAEGEQWRIVMNQQENNRYLFEMQRSPGPGKNFGPLDTISQQRLGTSFAVADSDNPGPKCIISGGLGSSEVEYKGKKYPVCCSGCAAAFNDDPERWLAKLAKAEEAMKKNE